MQNVEFISAGAGSGKTYNLTERLSGLLSGGNVSPAGIIATTFTRKAAVELKERVRQHLMKEGQVQLANQMERAAVSTVNAVCGELLQRFAFEAGMSPEQQVLDERDASHLFAESMDQVIGSDLQRLGELNHRAYRLGVEDWSSDVRDIAKEARANDIPTA
ncbi:MAG: UvrD-helicase domain-containing protein, partial [Pseudohongiellaceae bacterium]